MSSFRNSSVPRAFFFTAEEVNGKRYYGAKVIPGRGAWLEFETTTGGCINVKIDRRRKIPVTTFLRALGVADDAKIRETFADVDNGAISYINSTLEKDTTNNQYGAFLRSIGACVQAISPLLRMPNR